MENFLEQAFGRNDVTTPKMRAALREWFDLYCGAPRPQEDTALRPAALIVGKLCRTVFAEYEYERDPRTGEVLPGYPDVNNHHIDAVRYAVECIWRRRGS